jgi:hypothetical protein
MRFSNNVGSWVGIAQLEAWTAVHKGTVDTAARAIDATLADAALGRMIIRRQRAVVAEVVRQFFARAGGRFSPFQGQILWGTSNPSAEAVTANVVEQLATHLSGDPVATLFERAQRAELNGQYSAALADFESVRERYPGFLPAAIASARLALSLRRPEQAVRALLCVERELLKVRNGAAILADGLRELGFHHAASRYDLAALTNFTHDSLANVCAPVDVTGKVVGDHQMPPAFWLEVGPNGRSLYNDRGIYYEVSPYFEGAAFALRNAGSAPPVVREAKFQRLYEAVRTRVKLFLFVHAPGHVLDQVSQRAVAARVRLIAVSFSLRRGSRSALIFLLPYYKTLPSQVRYILNLCVIPLRRRRFAQVRAMRSFKVLTGDRLSAIVQSRIEAGLKRVLVETVAECTNTQKNQRSSANQSRVL